MPAVEPRVRTNPDDIYIPINVAQLRTLIGKMLTHVDAMGLPETVEKANKDLIKQSIFGWYAEATENATTSTRGCIAPIHMLRDHQGKERKTVWTAEGNHAVSLNLNVKDLTGETNDPGYME